MKNKREIIKEMGHIEVQEHINDCPECIKEYKKEMEDVYEKGKKDARQETIKEIEMIVEKVRQVEPESNGRYNACNEILELINPPKR